MYKFLHNSQIHFALGFHEARRQAEFTLPEDINPINHFIVRVWHWDEHEKDYSIEVFDAPGYQVFKEYDDALTCFNALAVDYPEEAGEEIKLELIQYHRGKVTTYHSKILFPSVLAREP
jgi:hypothetical protein